MEKKHMSLLLITHDLGVVAETAENVAVMYTGRIMECCDVKTLFTNPLNPYTEGLLRSLPHGGGGRLRTIQGMVPPQSDLPEGCKFSTRCDYAFDRCFVEEPELLNISGQTGMTHLVRCWLRQP